MVFRGLFLSRNSLKITFDRYQDLVLFLRQYSDKTVDDVVEFSKKNQMDCLLKILLSLYVLQSLTIVSSIEPSPMIIFITQSGLSPIGVFPVFF